MIYCPHCGTQNPDGSTFCSECGKSLTAVSSQSPPVQNSTPQQPNDTVNLSQIRHSKFFAFISPFVNAIDNGKFFKNPFQWLYIIFGILCIIYPVYFLLKAIDIKIFDIGGFPVVLLWVFTALAGWVGVQIWWNRESKINSYLEKGNDFLAIPTFSHFIQTFGEWYGATVAIIGFGLSLSNLITNHNSGTNNIFGINQYYNYQPNNYDFGTGSYLPGFLGHGFLGLFLFPVIGFFIITIFRFVAESIRALASIANNTKRNNA